MRTWSLVLVGLGLPILIVSITQALTVELTGSLRGARGSAPGVEVKAQPDTGMNGKGIGIVGAPNVRASIGGQISGQRGVRDDLSDLLAKRVIGDPAGFTEEFGSHMDIEGRLFGDEAKIHNYHASAHGIALNNLRIGSGVENYNNGSGSGSPRSSSTRPGSGFAVSGEGELNSTDVPQAAGPGALIARLTNGPALRSGLNPNPPSVLDLVDPLPSVAGFSIPAGAGPTIAKVDARVPDATHSWLLLGVASMVLFALRSRIAAHVF